VQEKLKPRHKLNASQQAALTRSATLLEQKAGLERRVGEIARDRSEKLAIREKLFGLRSKMQDVGAELYQTRIDRISGALPLLDEQIGLSDKLLQSYGRTLKMVEIEIESSSAADALPEALALEMGARQDEIAEIEARTSHLKLLLSSNEEVERFLRDAVSPAAP
jgi:chromosome segregation ATPase